MSVLKQVVSHATAICSAAAVAGVGFAIYYRPVGDNGADQTSVSNRNGTFMSPESLCDRADKSPPFPYRLASAAVIFATTTVTRTFIYGGGKFHVQEDENYYNFLKRVQKRDGGMPLLTASNHRSMLDDPAMMSSLLPLWMAVQPQFVRWSVCSQEFCFNPEYSSLIHVFSGLGKVMPIKRGAGINQKLLLDFARRLAAGEWCHVFPEGGIWQRPTLGGRENGREHELGHLKWGVGKLIAHSPKRVVVIPFFQHGMETIMPQHPVTKKIDSHIPRPGHDVSVRIGEEIDFDDLIAEHERTHGELRKYSASVEEEKGGDFHEHWDSKPEELELYHKITSRIEERLNILNTGKSS